LSTSSDLDVAAAAADGRRQPPKFMPPFLGKITSLSLTSPMAGVRFRAGANERTGERLEEVGGTPTTLEVPLPFAVQVLSAASESAVSRLDAFPCARCRRPEAAAALQAACEGSSGGSGERVTVVTHVGGSASWWVRRVDLRTVRDLSTLRGPRH
jgi:hypothetical protein